MNIYATAPVGTAGAEKLYNDDKDFFKERFADFFIKRIEDMFKDAALGVTHEAESGVVTSAASGITSNAPSETAINPASNISHATAADALRKFLSNEKHATAELKLAKIDDCIYICTMAEKGIFGALWEACEDISCGCEVFLEKIPIRQEVIEICELKGENPYEIDSSGAFLIFTELDEYEIAEFCSGNDLPSKMPRTVQIGRTLNAKERVIINGDKKRFLTPPERQKKDILNRRSTSGKN